MLLKHHPDREHDQVKRFFRHLTLLMIGEPHPQQIGYRGMVDLGGKAPDQADPFVLAAGIQELLEGSAGGLDIHVEKSSRYFRELMPDRLDQAECISTADLRAVEVSDRFIPASDALKKGDGPGKLTVRGTG